MMDKQAIIENILEGLYCFILVILNDGFGDKTMLTEERFGEQ